MKGIVPPKHKRRANEEAPREFFKIFTPIQTAKLLWAAHEHCPELVAGLAIKIFSGVRNTELYTLTWENIHLEKERDSQIIVLAAFSKTGRKRAISIHPTLYQWLSPRVCNPEDRVFGMASHVKDRESVWLDAIKLSRKFAGIDPWPQNALRHGFGSYHYALYKNETLTASEVGDSTGVVRRHYIDAVRAKACGIFWSLTPANVEAFVTSDTETKEPILEEPEPEPDPPEEEFAGQQVSCLPCLKNVEI